MIDTITICRSRSLWQTLVVLCSALLLNYSGVAQVMDPADYADPLVGTLSKYELSHGNTYPAIARPWGMHFWTAQTGNMGNGWIYTYTADKIKGFRQTHQPSPWNNDYGQFALMPVVGTVKFNQDDRASWFSHKAEVAKPYYYSAYLADYDIVTELSPSSRAAIFRVKFPATDSAAIIIDAFDKGSYIKVVPSENKIFGYSTKNSGGVPSNFKNYFVIEFDKPFSSFLLFAEERVKEGVLELKTDHAGASVQFKTKKGETVHVRVASSFISYEQAEINLMEVKGKSFDHVVREGREHWNEVLGKVEIEDNNLERLKTFYSCLYRSTLFPRDISEVDAAGNRIHYSPYNGQVLPGYMFTDTGFWDTFRSLFPLLNLLYPSMNVAMQEGLVNAYKESGFLPEWASPGHRASMIGNNSASVVSDAYLQGLKGYDAELLWEAVVHGANHVHPSNSSTGRAGVDWYKELGYIPFGKDVNQNVARTLEYAYSDWCIYRFGQKLQKSSQELEPFRKGALNYRNLYDKETRLMRAKNDKGEFIQPFDPSGWTREYTEGNAWHWSFCVFHDPKGLINLMGGEEKFIQMLDTVFVIPSTEGMNSRSMIHEMREMQVMNMGQYAHGNQPIQHMPYLYNYAAAPWKTQYWVRQIMDKLYAATPDGYCGDEDNGQTSAWFVFSSLGFYPVSPGSNEYVIGSPLFKKATLHLENGKKVLITTDNQQQNAYYIQDMTWNKKTYRHNYLRIEDLVKGANLNFKMLDKPNYKRGVNKEDVPYSFSNEVQDKL
ncbi:GH92 family glycosyl hydrolase [Sphingobacterium sp. LRF_L2]|uniref:GH92 family glycosyl hydrolase n=1 Tax=Sphingobacterium sp. LRF_L2 TaxID=3369421 RepID=UPI003F61129E